jgi:carboxyl-terminal processing protease
MKFTLKNSLFLPVSFCALVLFGFIQDEQDLRKKAIIGISYEALNGTHFNPRVINDQYSKDVLDLYLKRMDYRKLYFMKSDIQSLKPFETTIDDQMKIQDYSFYLEVNKLMDQRTSQTELWVTEILKSPFDFNQQEKVEADPEKLEWASNEMELKDRWRRGLKLQVLTQVYDKEMAQMEAASKSDTVKLFRREELEMQARKKVQENMNDQFSRMKKQKETDKFAFFVNVLVGVYDPHTNFFPPAEKKQFDISMSGKLEGIGAKLQQVNGYLKITEVVPGSPSWKQGELQVNDLIMKVAQGMAEPVDIGGWDQDEAIALIRGKKGTEVRLTVKKQNGDLKVIPIIRDVIELDETFARSLVVTLEGSNKKIGYLHLPKFYADFADANGRRCAADVKKELDKLKNEGVDGLIMDLRNNGGGSLSDVVKMAGYFIPSGPIVLEKRRTQPAFPHNDPDNGVEFEKPMVVLVNNFSASASEIFAAAMQDYKRAIIMGTSSTFGKGTVQNFFDLDNGLPNNSTLRPIGQVKVTISKFYRINGTTTQKKGVIPDIIFPDPYQFIPNGERAEDFPLEDDVVTSASYKVCSGNITANYSNAVHNSQKRLSKNQYFITQAEAAKRAKHNKDQSEVVLNYTAYSAKRKQDKIDNDQFNNASKEISGWKFINPKADMGFIQSDTLNVKKNESWVNGMKKDAQLFEAVQVMQDLMK